MIMPNSAIPKFSSFRPRDPPSGPAIAPSKDVDPDEAQGDNKVDRRKQARDTKRQKEADRQDTSHKLQHWPVSYQRLQNGPQLSKPSLVVEGTIKNLCFIDKQGDVLNITYGSIDKRKVPSFTRRGAGSILGLPSKCKIDRDQSTDKYIVTFDSRSHDLPPRPSYRKSKSLLSKASKLVVAASSTDSFGNAATYVPLSRKRKRILDSENNHDNLAIATGEPVEVPGSDIDMDFGNEASPDYLHHDGQSIRQENARLIRQSSLKPQNLENWLDLLNHQEHMMRLGRNHPKQELTNSERQALADIKISIYEEAMAKITNSEALETLWAGMLDQGASIWEEKKILQKWHQAVTRLPTSFQLRVGRLNYLQTSQTLFFFDRCKAEYIDTLVTLKNIFDLRSSPEDRSVTCQQQVYILLRFTSYLRHAGYHELALAMWQASLDFTIFRPTSVSHNSALQLFAQYWDSETYRLGDSTDASWSTFQASKPPLPDPIIHPTPEITPSTNLFRHFVDEERKLERALQMPGRTIDQVGEDDPFHVILFSDVEPILTGLITDPLINQFLISGLLCFAGLPQPLTGSLSADYTDCWKDPFLYDNFSETDQVFCCERKIKVKHLFFGTEFMLMQSMSPSLKVDEDWLQRVCLTLANRAQADDRFIEYTVALLCTFESPAAAAKFAKRCLRLRSSSLRLYNAYYLVEQGRDRTEIAQNVISTALDMSASLDESDQSDAILLWRTWIWQDLQHGSVSTAAHRLLSIGSSGTNSMTVHTIPAHFSVASVLRARQWLRQGQRQALHADDPINFVFCSELLMLLSYLEHQSTLAAIEAPFQEILDLLVSCNRHHSRYIEPMHDIRAYLASYHATTVKSHRPAQVRDILLDSMKLFPHNLTLHQLYTLHERSFGVIDRLRSDFLTISDSKAVHIWLFLIHREICRDAQTGGTAHAVRALFERSVHTQVGMHSPAIWTAYLRFEISQARPDTVNNTLMRGLANLPWVKHLILLGLAALEGVLEFNQVRDIYQVLEDRELRTHVNLVDTLEQYAAGNK